MKQVATQNSLLPASFSSVVRGDRSSFQTSIILSVLNNAIEQSRAVSREDIINAYKKAQFKGRPTKTETHWDRENKKWVYKQILFDECKIWYPHALQWFKSNLGSAIIKGKILAIPVIDI